jgi:hypothetical protein
LPPVTPSRYEYTAQRTITESYEVEQSNEPPVESTESAVPHTTPLKDWLLSIDNLPSRQHPEIKYMNLLKTFEMEEVFTVSDVLSLSSTGLRVVGIKAGTATHLLTYAGQDVQ